MDESPSNQSIKTAFELALPVIAGLRDILEINLKGCNVWLKSWSSSEVSVFVNSTANAMLVPENQRLDVFATLILEVRRAGEGDADLHIEAKFQIGYKLKPDTAAGLAQANVDAFASLNGLYNIWPYWREFVQSVTTRMGLPPIVIPVFRIDPKANIIPPASTN